MYEMDEDCGGGGVLAQDFFQQPENWDDGIMEDIVSLTEYVTQEVLKFFEEEPYKSTFNIEDYTITADHHIIIVQHNSKGHHFELDVRKKCLTFKNFVFRNATPIYDMSIGAELTMDIYRGIMNIEKTKQK
jgi:hypothetical protein